jgi:apolipoprotein N-acyltransferase
MTERPASLPAGRLAVVGMALAAGAAAALAFPPFGFLTGLLGYALLLSLWDRAGIGGERPDSNERSLRRRAICGAFWRGWLAGSAYFLISTWWVAEAFMVDAKYQGWMAPIAVTLLATGFGLFWGAAGVVYVWLRPRGPGRVLVFAGCFCLLEWLRGHLLTGFPWDLAGETWRAGSAPSQAAALVGAYGLSWITTAASATPALLLDRDHRRGGATAVGVAALGVTALYGFGAARLAHPPASAPNAPWVRVVQADVDQSSKYDEALFRSIVERYVTLTARPSTSSPAGRPPDIVIWPEGAIPAAVNDYLAPDTWTRAAITAALQPGQTLLLGAYRVDGPFAKPIYYNSLLSLRRQADGLAPIGVYDKFRLVPFGEFLPLENLLAPLGIKDLVHVGDGFTGGPPPRPMALPGLPSFQPLICYESLFPGLARDGARSAGRPAWIVNISNDAWFGRSSGPWQHLNLASYRAIEEGLPIVRATPTGVSAVIDAFGRIRPGARLESGTMGVIDAPLPPALPPTQFSRTGDLFFELMMALSTVIALIGRMTSLKSLKQD